MDPRVGDELDSFNKVDCAIGKANRAQGKVSEYSEVPALQALGPTWRLQVPVDLITAPKAKPGPRYLTALIRDSFLCGDGFPRRDNFGFSANRGHLIDGDFDSLDEGGAADE